LLTSDSGRGVFYTRLACVKKLRPVSA
jgi:hypothetical protein